MHAITNKNWKRWFLRFDYHILKQLKAWKFQKQTEIGDLNEIRNALDDECNKKNEESGTYSAEIQSLNEKLVNSDKVLAEVRVSLNKLISIIYFIFSKDFKLKSTVFNKRFRYTKRHNLMSMEIANP